MDKQERIQVMTRIGDLIEHKCQGCKHNGGQNNTTKTYCHNHCSVGKELLSLGKKLDEGGNNVPTVTEKEQRLPFAKYQELKAKGKKDKEIAEQFNYTPQHLSTLKKKWGIRKAHKKKPQPKEIKSDRIEEMKQILSEKDHLISVQKAKIQELENKESERISFLISEINRYSQLNHDLSQENGRYYDRIVFLDQQHENDKKSLEHARKALESLTKENGYLKGLLLLYMEGEAL